MPTDQVHEAVWAFAARVLSAGEEFASVYLRVCYSFKWHTPASTSVFAHVGVDCVHSCLNLSCRYNTLGKRLQRKSVSSKIDLMLWCLHKTHAQWREILCCNRCSWCCVREIYCQWFRFKCVCSFHSLVKVEDIGLYRKSFNYLPS